MSDMKRLVISEKPSVARSIAAVIGAVNRHDGYLEGGGYIVSWCIGHLIASAEPDSYDPKYKNWRHEDLPIIPKDWKYTVNEQTRQQYEVLKKLMHDPQVSEVICATDAGREGELIFRLVYMTAGCTLPVKRLWISSLETEAIRRGFMELRDGRDYDDLYHAALCREHADWLVGMNATRLFSLLYGRTLKVGRVMSPTLAMIVSREEAIRDFKPEKFYTVMLNTKVCSQSERISSKADAEAIRDQCSGQTAVVKEIQTKQRSEKPPHLYDLTTLQRDANRIFGYTAQQTLDYTQSLYEKKLVTYPRTDSRYLTHDMAEALPDLVNRIGMSYPYTAGLVLPVNTDQVIDDKKVSDHHAIIPTMAAADKRDQISAGESDILSLIAISLLCAVGEPYQYEETTVITECAGHLFTAKGRRTVRIGWKAPWNTFRGSVGPRGDFHEEADLAIPSDLHEGETYEPAAATLKEGTTSSPQRYTEDSILSAMENAGNGEMPEDAERRGIGTPATRASVLEKLVAEGLIERKGSGRAKHLVPTSKGCALIAVLPEQLQSPLLTAEWEQHLKQIEHGQANPDHFMNEICDMLKDLVQNVNRVPEAAELFPSQHESLGKCPNCGAAVSETARGFFCENRTCRFGIWKNNRFLVSSGKPPTAEMVKSLLQDGQITLKGLRSKTGKLYEARLVLDCAEDGSARIRPVFN